MDTDVFTSPTCDLTTPVATTAPATTAPADTPTTAPGGGTVPPGGGTTPPGGTIPRTGSQAETTLLLAAIALTLGLAATGVARRKTVPRQVR